MLAARDRRSGDDSLSAVALIKTIERLIGERGETLMQVPELGNLVAAIGALGTSSFALVDATKIGRNGGISNSGFWSIPEFEGWKSAWSAGAVSSGLD